MVQGSFRVKVIVALLQDKVVVDQVFFTDAVAIFDLEVFGGNAVDFVFQNFLAADPLLIFRQHGQAQVQLAAFHGLGDFAEASLADGNLDLGVVFGKILDQRWQPVDAG